MHDLSQISLYTASRRDEESYLNAFLAILTNQIKIEKPKTNSQLFYFLEFLLYGQGNNPLPPNDTHISYRNSHYRPSSLPYKGP